MPEGAMGGAGSWCIRGGIWEGLHAAADGAEGADVQGAGLEKEPKMREA